MYLLGKICMVITAIFLVLIYFNIFVALVRFIVKDSKEIQKREARRLGNSKVRR